MLLVRNWQRDLALRRAIGHVRAERRRRGIGDLRGGDEAGGLADGARPLEQGRHRPPVGIDADGAVVGPDAARERGRAGRRVGHGLLGIVGVGAGEARVAQLVHRELAVLALGGEPDELAMRNAHAVAVQEDHVLRPVAATVIVSARLSPESAGLDTATDEGRRG